MSEMEIRSYLQNMFKRYKYKSKVRDIHWELTLDEFQKITSSNCAYCGAEPKPRRWPYGNKDPVDGYRYCVSAELLNGIDRIDNAKGYTLTNSAPCCGTCNAMKSKLSVDEFLTHVLSIYRYMESK